MINEDIFVIFLIKLNFCENRSDFRYRGMILKSQITLFIPGRT